MVGLVKNAIVDCIVKEECLVNQGRLLDGLYYWTKAHRILGVSIPIRWHIYSLEWKETWQGCTKPIFSVF